MKTNKNGNKELTTSVKFQNGTTNVDAPNPTKSIEHIAENGAPNEEQPKRFLTKKKIILSVIFMLVAIGFAAVTVRPILQVDWHSFNVSVGTGFAQNWGWLWLFLILVQIFVNFNRGFFTFIPRLKSWGYNISYGEYMLFSLTCSFIGAISPGNFLYDPYNIFWLKTHGVPTSKAVSIYFVNSLFWQIAQILLTMPFFIVCCTDIDRLVHSTNPWGKVLFSAICIGVIIDFVSLFFFVLMNWSKNFHYACARFFNWIKKLLHMKYHTKEQTAKKYKEQAHLRKSFIEQMKDWKTTLWILGFWILGDLIGLFSMPVCLNFVQHTIGYIGDTACLVRVDFNIWKTLMCARLAVPANRLNILPGQAMGYPAALKELLNIYGGWKISPQEVIASQGASIQKNVISNALLTGQIFLAWLPAIAGIAGFIVLTKQQITMSNKGTLFDKK